MLVIEDYEPSPPGPGEVAIEVRAIGLNPVDYKRFSGSYIAGEQPPLRVGSEVAGVISAIGEGTQIASGSASVGDEVIAYRVDGGYATALTVPAETVFAKPANLTFPEAANLLLVGATAKDMIRVGEPTSGETLLVHSASSSVGISLLQQLADLDVRIIGTAGEHSFDVVRRFGGEPIAYGAGLTERVRELAPDGIDVAFDIIGNDEAIETSLELLKDKSRLVEVVNHKRALAEGFRGVGASDPESGPYRDTIRGELVQLAAEGRLVVPVSRTFPFAEAREALEFVRSGHPGGKVAIVP